MFGRKKEYHENETRTKKLLWISHSVKKDVAMFGPIERIGRGDVRGHEEKVSFRN